jgi:hypothetical protein
MTSLCMTKKPRLISTKSVTLIKSDNRTTDPIISQFFCLETTDTQSTESHDQTTEAQVPELEHSEHSEQSGALEMKYIILIVFSVFSILVLATILIALIVTRRLPRIRMRVRSATRVESSL